MYNYWLEANSIETHFKGSPRVMPSADVSFFKHK